MSERWIPENGENYWFINFSGAITKDAISLNGNHGMEFDSIMIENGNCFRTRAEAEAAAKKVKELLLSLHYNGTSTANDETLKDKSLPKLTTEVFDRPDCPVWAQYAAVDANGGGFFYKEKPRVSEADGEWLVDKCITGLNLIISDDFDPTDWQNSLIEHPNKAAFEKMLENYAEQQANKILQIARERRLPEQYGNAPEETELPDWCKVGEWVYLSNAKYYKIKKVDSYGIILDCGIVIRKDDIHAEAVSARLRPWNFEEAPFVVKCRHSITAIEYQVAKLNSAGDGYTVADCCCDVTLQGMANYYEQMDGSPCGVLEHLENGKWVR